MLTISTENKSFDKIIEIIDKFKSVYGTYGIHPHEAKSHQNIRMQDIINKVNQNKKIIGIGETGLDFYYNHSEKKDQINCFEQHIYAAQETDLPIVVHTRSAEKETLELLKDELDEIEASDLYNALGDLLKDLDQDDSIEGLTAFASTLTKIMAAVGDEEFIEDVLGGGAREFLIMIDKIGG